MRMRRREFRATRASRRGVTLVEVMIVIAILVVLMASLTFALMRQVETSKQMTTQLQLQQFEDALILHAARGKAYPTAEEGLGALFPGAAVPNDGWGRPFLYAVPGPGGAPFEVRSLGADGAAGGTGLDSDLTCGHGGSGPVD